MTRQELVEILHRKAVLKLARSNGFGRDTRESYIDKQWQRRDASIRKFGGRLVRAEPKHIIILKGDK